mmetsp:Transcript_8018/g.22117  ORF Transcript_8018/g.22117 Transcript_8018/m.22117 type:complete len:241 (-) Transcript_8018:278-1000(-)
MKRVSGQAYLANRADNAPPPKRSRVSQNKPLFGGFAELLQEGVAQPRSDFEALHASNVDGGLVGVSLEAEGADRTAQPRCVFWTLCRDAPPIGPVVTSQLDLELLSLETCVVAIVAEVVTGESQRCHEGDIAQRKIIAKNAPPLAARLVQRGKESNKELLRVRRHEGVQPGGLWFVGVLRRDPAGKVWRAEAVDEVFPASRFESLLPLRCKDFILAVAPRQVADVGDETQRMLEEALKDF